MSASAYSWHYILKCVGYHGLKQNGREDLGNPFVGQMCYENDTVTPVECQRNSGN